MWARARGAAQPKVAAQTAPTLRRAGAARPRRVCARALRCTHDTAHFLVYTRPVPRFTPPSRAPCWTTPHRWPYLLSDCAKHHWCAAQQGRPAGFESV
eukprot:4535776-Pleurochrysis_carterae.AAC.5